MYQAAYKCRLCKEEFQAGELYTQNKVIKKVTGISMIVPFALNNRGTILHVCEDDSLGIADFQGFKKAED